MAGVRKLIYGIGINDSPFTQPQHVYEYTDDGKKRLVGSCPYYMRWRTLLQRCYHLKTLEKHPTYFGCSVSPDWLRLSNFIEWVDSQPNKNWQNCHLDKDLLFKGNKLYSPDTCVFVDRSVNNFLTDRKNSRGKYLLGVTKNKGRFRSRCNNPLTCSEVFIGNFSTELEAHSAWKAKKHEYACILADRQEDSRVAEALRNFYII
jgi:hypothetical protein